MTTKPDGGPAFPLVIEEEGCLTQVNKGMSLRAYAAIKLCVPDSGLPWLDDMIRQARHDRFAGQALAGVLANWPADARIDERRAQEIADFAADAMLAARGGRDG